MDCANHSHGDAGFERLALRRRATRPIISRSRQNTVNSGRFHELPYWVGGQKDRPHIRRRAALNYGRLFCFIVLLRWFGRLRTDIFGEPDTLKGVRPVRRGAVGNVLARATRWLPTLS